MKTLFNTKISIALIVFFALGSCGKDLRTFPENESSAITMIEGPTTVKAGEELLVKVTLQGNNGCAVSGELKEIADGNLRTKFITKGRCAPRLLFTSLSIIASKLPARELMN